MIVIVMILLLTAYLLIKSIRSPFMIMLTERQRKTTPTGTLANMYGLETCTVVLE